MILDWEKWLPLLKRNVPIALLFFILGCTATYAVVYQLVLESKNAKIEILQTELDHEKIENTKSIEKITTLSDDLEIIKQQKAELVGKLEKIQETSSEKDFQQKLKDYEKENEQNTKEIKKLKDTQQMPSNLENDSKIVKNDKSNPKYENNEESETIEKLLALADKQIVAKKYTTPQNDNAFETYQQVLTLVPNNEQATKGLGIVYANYINLTRSEISNKNYKNAKIYLDRSKLVNKNGVEIPDLEKMLHDEISQQRNNIQIETPTNSQDKSSPEDHKELKNSSNIKAVDFASMQNIHNTSYPRSGFNSRPLENSKSNNNGTKEEGWVEGSCYALNNATMDSVKITILSSSVADRVISGDILNRLFIYGNFTLDNAKTDAIDILVTHLAQDSSITLNQFSGIIDQLTMDSAKKTVSGKLLPLMK